MFVFATGCSFCVLRAACCVLRAACCVLRAACLCVFVCCVFARLCVCADVNEFAVMTSTPFPVATENTLYTFHTITASDVDAASTYTMTIVAGNNGSKIQVR